MKYPRVSVDKFLSTHLWMVNEYGVVTFVGPSVDGPKFWESFCTLQNLEREVADDDNNLIELEVIG